MTGVFGTHRFTGQGTFIAAGIGIAPFLAIARSHTRELGNSTLIWSVKTHADLLYEAELKATFKDVIITLTQETRTGYGHGRITPELLKGVTRDNVQVCGSYEFTQEMKRLMAKLNRKSP